MRIENINHSGWSVILTVDDDGHLTFFASHEDGSQPIDCDYECDFDDEFGVRLSTHKIEADYLASLEVQS